MDNEKRELDGVENINTENENEEVEKVDENNDLNENLDAADDAEQAEETEENQIADEAETQVAGEENDYAEAAADMPGGAEDFDGESEYLTDGETADGEETADAEFEEDMPKKNKKLFGIIALVVVVLAVLAVVYSLLVENGVGSKTVVNTKLPASATQSGEPAEESEISIKFENPFITMFESGATGKESALKAGNYSVSKSVFEYFVKSSALNYEYGLYQNKEITDLSKFAWSDVNKETGLTNAEIAKGKAVELLAPIAGVLSVAADNGISLSKDDEKEIEDMMTQIKSSYGDKLNDALKQSGFDSLDQLKEVQKLQKLYSKAYEAFNENPTEHMKGFKDYRKELSDDKITVKHILIKFPDGVNKDSSDDEKAETKKKAEKVLEMVNAGEDFDSLIEKYNEDPGAGKNGYTFANDGTMVQEFTDAAFALEVGKVSGLVETSYGYHIIKRTDRIPTFEEYSKIVGKKMTVKLNRPYYSKLSVDVNLEDYISESQQSGSNNSGENK